jgi:hypothetical protein
MSAGRIIAAGAAVAGLMLASGALAAGKPKNTAERAAAFDKVAACRKIEDAPQRLACFDKAVADLEAAEKAGDVVVVDRAQIHEAKKQAFGLPNIDALNIFNRGAHVETVDKISGVIAKATLGGDGKWVLETTDGQVWSETDAETFYPEPEKGDHIEIRRGMLGSFFVKINNNASFKVRREK